MKGVKEDDILIDSSMRELRGGVVDFYKKSIKNMSKNQKEILNSKKKKQTQIINHYSHKEKESSSKKIQSWWRGILNSFTVFNKKIVQIQSYWRGYWVRNHLYDIVYYSIITNNFVAIVNDSLNTHFKLKAFSKLIEYFGVEYNKKVHILKFIKLQRTIKAFLKKKRKNNQNIFETIIKIFNNKTFIFLKRYSFIQQMKIERVINVFYINY